MNGFQLLPEKECGARRTDTETIWPLWMCSPPLLTQVVATAADLGPSHPNLSAWVSLVATERGLGVMHITNEGRKLDITQVSSLLPKEPVKCSVD